MQGCLAWLETSAADEFIRYVDHNGAGLSNQGWKDSHDSVQWRDGTLARAPIAGEARVTCDTRTRRS